VTFRRPRSISTELGWVDNDGRPVLLSLTPILLEDDELKENSPATVVGVETGISPTRPTCGWKTFDAANDVVDERFLGKADKGDDKDAARDGAGEGLPVRLTVTEATNATQINESDVRDGDSTDLRNRRCGSQDECVATKRQRLHGPCQTSTVKSEPMKRRFWRGIP
jgi:hypothetical protein